MCECVTPPVRSDSALEIRPVPHRMNRLVPVGSDKGKSSTGKANKKGLFIHMREILLADLLKDLAWGLPGDSFKSK